MTQYLHDNYSIPTHQLGSGVHLTDNHGQYPRGLNTAQVAQNQAIDMVPCMSHEGLDEHNRFGHPYSHDLRARNCNHMGKVHDENLQGFRNSNITHHVPTPNMHRLFNNHMVDLAKEKLRKKFMNNTHSNEQYGFMPYNM